MKKITKKITISIAIFIATAICATFLFIRSNRFLRWVERQVETELTHRMREPYQADIGKIEGTVFGNLTLDSLTISKQNEPVITTGKITLKYNLLRLLTRKFEATHLKVEAPVIHTSVEKEGLNLFNIFQPAGKKKDTPEFSVAIGSLNLENGTLHYTDGHRNLDLTLSGITLEVKGPLNSWNHTGTFKIEKAGRFTRNGDTTPIRAFAADFQVSATSSTLDPLFVEFGNSTVEITGAYHRGFWNTTVDMSLSVADIQPFLSEPLDLHGDVHATLTLNGTPETAFAGTLSVDIPAVALTPHISLAYGTLEAEITTQHLTLKTLQFQVADGTVDGEGHLTLKNTPKNGNPLTYLQHLPTLPITYSGTWNVKQVQLNRLLTLFTDIPEPLKDATGHLSSSGTFHGKRLALEHLNLNGQIALTQTTLADSERDDSTLQCAVEAGEVNVHGNIDKMELHIAGAFPATPQDVLQIHATDIPLETLMTIANAPDLGGTAEFTATLSAGTLTGDIQIPNATFTDIPLGVFTGTLHYQDRHVFLENATLTQKESRTRITGKVAIQDEFPANFTIIADPIYVQHYPKLLLGAEYPVNGHIQGELQLAGTLTHLDGSATFSVTEADAWGIALDTLTLPLEIQKSHLRIPGFKITTRGQQLTLHVTVAPTGDYALRLDSDTPVDVQEIAQAANIPDFPFHAHLDVKVKGSLKKPERPDFQMEFKVLDLTYATHREPTHPLGDVYLTGKLIERKNTIGEPDIFEFHGHAFDRTSQIHGYVSTAPGNPYQFTAHLEAYQVKPLLSSLHSAIEVLTGTVDGTASITGTLAALAPSTETPQQQVTPYDLDILLSRCQMAVNFGRRDTAELDRSAFSFTNAEPIHLHLKDGTWALETLSLKSPEETVPFLHLTGTFDERSEDIHIHATSEGAALPPIAEALGMPPGTLHAGILRYDLKATGTTTHPNLRLHWELPALTIHTQAGDMDITDAGGTLTYQQETLRFEECAFNLFGNPIYVQGYIDVHPKAINTSELHLRVDTIALDLAKNFPRQVLQPFGPDIALTGTLEASTEIGGTLAEPLLLLYAETATNQPIRFPAPLPAVTLKRLRVDIRCDAAAIHIQNVEAKGSIGAGTYTLQAKATLPRHEKNHTPFEMKITAEQVELGDYGFASGYVNLSGTALDVQHITLTGEIDHLELDGYDFQLTQRAPIRFRSTPPTDTEDTEDTDPLNAHIPLRLTSPFMDITLDGTLAGSLTAPDIDITWHGTLAEKQCTGNIHYQDQRITLNAIQLKNHEATVTLAGSIPLNLALEPMQISQRFLPDPLDVRLRGSEVPLHFFPGTHALFSQSTGTVDIDVHVQGTLLSPALLGNISLQAPHLHLKHFHTPLQNTRILLSLRGDYIDITTLQGDIGTGTCRLEHGQITLDGFMPELFSMHGLKLQRVPLGPTLQHVLPEGLFEDVAGEVTTTLKTLNVPLNRWLTQAGQLEPDDSRLKKLIEVSDAEVSIDTVRLTFKALDQAYHFQNPHPTPIVLKDGTCQLTHPFILENQAEFSVEQTFTDEDTKPDGFLGTRRTLAAKTTLRLDAESKASVNGEFDTALRLRNFDVSTLTQTWPAPYRITGALSGSLQLSGTSSNPKITLRRHENEPAELYLHDTPIDLRCRLRYQNGEWHITQRRYLVVHFGDNQLTFSGSLPYALELNPLLTQLKHDPQKVWTHLKNTPIHGILDIEIKDLAMLPSVVPGLTYPRGTSDIHLELTGSLENPHAAGRVRFKNIGFQLSNADIHVKDSYGDIQISEKGAQIHTLQGTLNTGTFSIKGDITAPTESPLWEKHPAVNITTTLTPTVFEHPEAYRIDLADTELHLSGELRRPTVTGDLHISGGTYQHKWEPVRDWLTDMSIHETELFLDSPLLRNVHLHELDLQVDTFQVLSAITGGPTDIHIASSGKLFGSLHAPVFTGNLSILRGNIEVLGQTFDVLEGSRISNPSRVEFDPHLHIYLHTPNRIRGVLPRDGSTVALHISAALTGTLSNSNFSLSTSAETPIDPLSHGDILEFLLHNAALTGTLGGFTFRFHRPLDEDARAISAEYPLGKNVSINIETNEKREHGIDVEFKVRF